MKSLHNDRERRKDEQPYLKAMTLLVRETSTAIYTNFLAVKKLFMCKLCHMPTTTSAETWMTDHQNTRRLVLSLV